MIGIAIENDLEPLFGLLYNSGAYACIAINDVYDDDDGVMCSYDDGVLCSYDVFSSVHACICLERARSVKHSPARTYILYSTYPLNDWFLC